MSALAINERVIEVGASHPERRLFDAIMPIPYGTTYNAYVVIGSEKTALIDAVDPEKRQVLFHNLQEAGIRHLDYIVNLHAEQDHSGVTEELLQRFPGASLWTNARVRDLMVTHLHLPESRFTVVADQDTLSLGDRTLRFLLIPFAHWPDNMMAYLEEDRILFSSDLFGSHYATDKLFVGETAGSRVMEAARTYYAEIMMPFRSHVARHVARVRELDPRLIASSHGPVWYRPNQVLSAYEEWVSDRVRAEVTIPFVSMHDSTYQMVQRLASRLADRGVSVSCRNLASRPESLVLETAGMIDDLVDAGAMILASPTVMGGLHPAAAYAASTAAAVKPKTRYLGFMGSYGWGTRAEESFCALTASIKAERLETVLVKGLAAGEDLARIDALADRTADLLKAL